MNWGSVFSAIIGAVIGGAFLIGGQKLSQRTEADKIRKLLFVEIFDNSYMLDDYINSILKRGLTAATYMFPFNLSTSLFDSVEAEYLSLVSLVEYSKLRKDVNKIKGLKLRVFDLQKERVERGIGKDYYFETKQILILAQNTLLDSVTAFSNLLSSSDRKVLKLDDYLNKSRERLEIYKNAADSPNVDLLISTQY
jgi:hypothetical protein